MTYKDSTIITNTLSNEVQHYNTINILAILQQEFDREINIIQKFEDLLDFSIIDIQFSFLPNISNTVLILE